MEVSLIAEKLLEGLLTADELGCSLDEFGLEGGRRRANSGHGLLGGDASGGKLCAMPGDPVGEKLG